MGSRQSELQAKLRALRERKELAAMEEKLAAMEEVFVPVTSGRSLTADAVPARVTAAVRSLWDADSEPADLIPDDTGEHGLAVWMEEQLACHGIGRDCYVATGLSIKPWIGCIQTPGWTRILRVILPDPLILAEDLSAVVGFLELEYHYAVFTATTDVGDTSA